MIKTILTRYVWSQVVVALLFALPVVAQTTSGAATPPAKAKGIALTPQGHTPQGHILYDVALSSETRQTLQEAMNSARASNSASPTPAGK